jgi:hypothetical protein
MEVAGEEKLLSRRDDGAEFQVDGAGIVGGAEEACGTEIVLGAGEGYANGFSGIAQRRSDLWFDLWLVYYRIDWMIL